jgi:hypothetical protein
MCRGLTLLVSLCATPLAGATLTGRVVDANTGEPIAKSELVVVKTGQRTQTGSDGAFTLTVPAGDVALYVTTVGYGLLKKTVQVSDEAPLTIEFALEQDTAVRKESVTVAAGPFDTIAANPATEKTLSKSEIQSLSMVLIGDPLRAAQALPGVTSDNDFRAEFSVRGAAYRNLGVYIDGVLTDNFVHAANLGVGGAASSEKVSLSIVNSDNVSEMSLLPGAFPATYGDSSAAVLNMETRGGNFVKPVFRVSTGLLGSSAVADGPIANHKGSWLVSARTSYADYLQRFVEDITGAGKSEDQKSSLDYSDAQVKGAYNFSPSHQVGVSATYGAFAASQQLAAGAADLEELRKLDSDQLLAIVFWRFTPTPDFTLDTRGFDTEHVSSDLNRNLQTLDDSRRHQRGFRSDASYAAGRHTIEGGVYVRFLGARAFANTYAAPQPFLPLLLAGYNQSAEEDSYYLEDTWRAHRVALTAGGRLAHSDLTGQTVASPRAALAWTPGENWTVRAGGGSYAQFPDFEQLYGFFGNRRLQAERATHANFSVERRFGARTRIVAELYDREDRNQPFAFNEPLLEGGQPTAYGLPYRNVLRGHARGVEFTLQRRSANRLAGWVTYAYSSTNYTDRQDRLQFVSDFDQRHTLTAFGSYRFRPTFDVSSQWRYGSGIPAPGFFGLKDETLFLTSQRNTARLPYYGRLDLRANKAFLFAKWKLTVSGEVLNLLNRTNLIVVGTDPIRIYSSGKLRESLTKSFGVLPALAVAVSF